MINNKIILCIGVLTVLFLSDLKAISGRLSKEEKIMTLLNKVVENIPTELSEIDPSIDRIAIYNIKIERNILSTGISHILEGKIQSIFQSFEGIT